MLRCGYTAYTLCNYLYPNCTSSSKQLVSMKLSGREFCVRYFFFFFTRTFFFAIDLRTDFFAFLLAGFLFTVFDFLTLFVFRAGDFFEKRQPCSRGASISFSRAYGYTLRGSMSSIFRRRNTCPYQAQPPCRRSP